MINNNIHHGHYYVHGGRGIIWANNLYKNKLREFSAFTLSEVLISITIIGVIAVITIPLLFENYKKKETISRLKKAYSVISNGLRLSQLENGPFSTWPIGAEMTDVEEYFEQYRKPYFANIQSHSSAKELGYESGFCWKNLNGERIGWNVMSSSSRFLFTFLDGTVVFYPRNTTNSEGEPSYTKIFYIDINGSKKPNIIGKDVFVFYVVDNDNVKPYCYTNTKDYINSHCKKSMSGNNYNCCSAKIINDGWQIRDDYPW